MEDPKKEWRGGKYTKKKSTPQKPSKIKWKTHAYRIRCLERGCDRLVDPDINPICRKCRRRKKLRLGKEKRKEERAEKRAEEKKTYKH